MKKRLLIMLMAVIIMAGLLSGCGEKIKAVAIPDDYVLLTVNYFFTDWPVAEDGSDFLFGYDLANDTDEYKTVKAMVQDAQLSRMKTTDDFTPDFHFNDGVGGNRYDFKVFGEELIMRTPDDKFFTVTMDANTFEDMKAYIVYVRESVSAPANPYSEAREPTEEELVIFNEAMSIVISGTYEPYLVAIQHEAVTNYRFTATVIDMYPGSGEGIVEINIYVPIDGEPVLMNISPIE